MSNNLLRVALRASKIPQRSITSSSSVCSKNVVLDPKLREEIHPKIGTREIVGWGFNGHAVYADRSEFPAPAIRFKEDSPEIAQLREKEKGDWKSLTLEEKKQLYRASFCQTYSEMNAPTGEWKSMVAAILFGLTFTGWVWYYMKRVVYPPLPRTFTREWQEAELQLMLDQGQGAIQGVSSKWDYDKLEWKK